jgi:phosphoribosylaminoimidazole (AIR) synthetase
MVHITGGGLSKLKELMPDRKTNIEVHANHSLKPQEIFRYAYEELGVPSEKMYARFNNGIGYVIAVDPKVSKYALATLRKQFKADEIGYVKKGNGKVKIESEYESVVVEYR